MRLQIIIKIFKKKFKYIKFFTNLYILFYFYRLAKQKLEILLFNFI